MNETRKKRVNLLEDFVAEKDAFGPHQRVADAIADMIATEAGGKAVAVIGSWGSGKSTVFNLLKNKLESEKGSASPLSETKLFLFDAWSHEGDPLKRTFLEKTIDFLLRLDWIPNKEHWEKERAKIAQRYRESTTTTTPQLTGLGSIFAILLFLVPLGLAIVSSGTAEKWANTTIGAILCLVPLLFAVGLWLWKKLTGDFKTEDLFGLLVSKKKEIHKFETIEDPNPSSVEFQKWFWGLASDALTGNRKLLVVIDNLDRVAPEDALKLWSSMRTFLDFSGTDAPTWAGKLWVFAAFDETAIARLWKGRDGESLADTFLQKTFQIRFGIPAPLLSDWRKFLEEHLAKAFPDCTENDFYPVTRIYAILRAEKKPPTPRDIKVFVNQIGSLRRTAPEVIPLPHLALYVALSSQEWSPISGKPLPQQHRLESYLTPGWFEDLTALYYSMPREQAMQVQLNERVETALTEGKPDTIQELANLPGLDAVIERILEDRLPNWKKSEPRAIGKAAYALSPMFSSLGFAWKRMRELLQTNAAQVEAWNRIDKSSGQGLANLVRLRADEEFSEVILRALSRAKPESDPKTPASLDEIKTWTEGVFAVLRGVLLLGHEQAIQDVFRFGALPEEYLARLAVVHGLRENQDLWSHLRPGCQPDEVMKALAQIFAGGSSSPPQEAAIDVLVAVQVQWQWQPVVQEIQGRLSNLQCPPEEVGRCLRSLLRLRKLFKPADEALQNVAQGWLLNHLSAAQSANSVESWASCMLVTFLYNPEASAGTNHPRTQQGRNNYRQLASNPTSQPQVFDAIYALALELGYVEDILAKRNAVQLCRPWFDAILRNAAAITNTALPFTASAFVDNYQALHSAINDDSAFEAATRAMVDRGGLIPELAKRSVSAENVNLYRTVLAVKADPSLGQVVVSSLQRASKDDWLQDFDGNCDLAALTQQIAKMGVKPELEQNLQDALNSLGEKVLKNQIPKQIKPETCETLVEVLSSAQQEILKRNLRDALVDSDTSTANLLQLFGRVILDCSILTEKADDLVRLGFRKMLERRDEVELVWLKTVVSQCSELLTKCRPASKEDLIGRVRGLLTEKLDNKTAGLINSIAAVLRIKTDVKGSVLEK